MRVGTRSNASNSKENTLSEYTQYYQAFSARLQQPEGLSPDKCRCHGGGWILSDVDTWHKCPDHYKAGQPHPEDDFDHYPDETPLKGLDLDNDMPLPF